MKVTLEDWDKRIYDFTANGSIEIDIDLATYTRWLGIIDLYEDVQMEIAEMVEPLAD